MTRPLPTPRKSRFRRNLRPGVGGGYYARHWCRTGMDAVVASRVVAAPVGLHRQGRPARSISVSYTTCTSAMTRGSCRSHVGSLEEMADRSGIQWTGSTWNPTTGCNRISPGCDNCYALTLAARLKAMGQAKYQSDGEERTSGPGFGLAIHEDALDAPLKWRAPRLIFVNSMSDLFHEDVPFDFIQKVFDVMRRTPRHTYQVLTKRSKRLAALAPQIQWPTNVWMGVSIETARYAFRTRHLASVPAAVRFLSCEPLLGPIPSLDLDGIDWVIVGGESGKHARPLKLEWVRSIRQQCADRSVDLFVKQLGTVWSAAEGHGRTHGGDWTAWPPDIRIREMPTAKDAACRSTDRLAGSQARSMVFRSRSPFESVLVTPSS